MKARRYKEGILLCLLLLWTSVLSAQGRSLGARSAAMGATGLLQEDIWAAFNNQSLLAKGQGVGAGLFYHSPFHIAELSEQGIALSYGNGKQGLSLSMNSTGQEVFREQRIGLGYGLKLDPRFNIGLQINYHSLRFQRTEYGSTSEITGELSFYSKLSDEISLAFHLFNPSIGGQDEQDDVNQPTVMRFGAGYDFSEKVNLRAELHKDLDQEAVLRAGLEYHLIEELYLRAGMSSKGSLSTFGAGLELGRSTIDFGAAYHQVLGYSTQVSLSYRFYDKQG